MPRRRTGGVGVFSAVFAITLFVFALFNVTNAALNACIDLKTPKITSSNPIAPPSLLSPGVPGYASAVANNNLEFYVQSQPGAGTGDNKAYTRDVKFVLAGPASDTWDAAQGVNEGCKFHTPRFPLSATPSGTTILSAADLTAAPSDGDAPLCFFNHRYSVSLSDFRDVTKLNLCGFNVATETVDGVTYEVLSGRAHLRWADYDAMEAAQSVRPPFTTYYPMSIRIAKEASSGGNGGTSEPSPVVPKGVCGCFDRVILSIPSDRSTDDSQSTHRADDNTFTLKSFMYSKSSGSVTVQLRYNISLSYPYFPYFSDPTPGSQLVNTFGGLSLQSYPDLKWTHEFISGLDGRCQPSATQCTMEALLSLSWTPREGSCTLNSTQQFDFYIGCESGGTDVCGKKLRDVYPEAGRVVWGDVDYCAVRETKRLGAEVGMNVKE